VRCGSAVGLIVGFVALATAAMAQNDLDQILEGFETAPPIEVVPDAEDDRSAERWWLISGIMDLETAFNFDQDRPQYEGLAKLRSDARLQLDLQLPYAWRARFGGRAWYDFAYLIHGRDDFDQAVLDAYEYEAEVWETWIGGPIGARVDARLGRQINTFGTSETLRVVDVIFPIDNREPAAADLDALYLPELHGRLDVRVGGWELTALPILERRFSKNPPAGSSYLPPGPVPPVDEPANTLANTEVVLAARGSIQGVDIGLLGAYYFNDLPSFEVAPDSSTGVRRIHDRIWMLGGVAAGAFADWVLRGELAGFDGLTFANDPGGKLFRLDVLAGVDYYGVADTYLALDVVNRWFPGAPSAIEDAPDYTPTNLTEVALRIRRSLLRERMHLTFVGIVLGREIGSVFRLQGDYALDDAVSLTVGLLLYTSGDFHPYSVLGRNDRVFLGTTYRF
jgi:hypothetical protein